MIWLQVCTNSDNIMHLYGLSWCNQIKRKNIMFMMILWIQRTTCVGNKHFELRWLHTITLNIFFKTVWNMDVLLRMMLCIHVTKSWKAGRLYYWKHDVTMTQVRKVLKTLSNKIVIPSIWEKKYSYYPAT